MIALLACLALAVVNPQPRPEEMLLFPPEARHNHGSCIVELPNGDLLACWYRGSGERTADDVQILGARLPRGAVTWSAPFLMADTPGFPDCNPCMVVDPQKRLWLFWPAIIDNRWESALLKFQRSRDLRRTGAPVWEEQGVILLKPGPEFAAAVDRDLAARWEPARLAATEEQRDRLKTYLQERTEMARDKLKVRLGWMPRVHPFILPQAGAPGFRLIVPLYSDGFDFSLMAVSDDAGKTWSASHPIVGPGNVQPSLVRRKDGGLVAFFRDNGPPPQRVMRAESRDGGISWSAPQDMEIANPGSGVEAIALKSGRWILVNNDTERGRHRLAVHVSEDEGRTWPVTRYLERDPEGPGAGSYSYPSVIQTRDGLIHITYSFRGPDRGGESIKYVRFSEAWLLEGAR